MRKVLLLYILFFGILAAREIDYSIIIDKPHRNYFNIEISFDLRQENYIDFAMPAWTPGSYIIKNWAKNVIDVYAFNEIGVELKLIKLDKQTWRINTENSKKVVLRYKVYAYSVNNPYHAHIDKEFAYFNGAVIFMYVKGKTELPCNLEFIYPEDWEIHTSLQIKLSDNKYQAINYDEFIDCPAFIGKLHKFSFDVANKQHFVVFNKWFDINEDQITEDLKKLVTWFYNMFGELPYKHYTFFLRVSDSGSGGIEHLYSNVSAVTPQSLKGDINDIAYYSRLLMLESHEFFHLYNVKRIRPTALGPFDYTSEVYTKMLWVCEGFTSYYTHRPLSKAGILDKERVLESWTSYINRLNNNTALNLKSVSQYSYDAWLRSEIPDYSFRTYYTKGALIALLIDLKMRLLSGHKKNMDDFFYFLYHNIYKKNMTYKMGSFFNYLVKYSEIDFTHFFEKYINGTVELPLKEHLNKVGLDIIVSNKIPFTGVKLNRSTKEVAIVSYIYPDSPADQIGMGRGDHIISLAGEKVTSNNWNEILNQHELNEEIEIKWIHDNKLYEEDIKVTKWQVTKYEIIEAASMDKKQQQFLETWLEP